MGRVEDIAAFLDEDPFGECGPGTPDSRAHRPELQISWAVVTAAPHTGTVAS
jgi:hypothetical protein